METFCVSCKKYESSSVRKTKQNRLNALIKLCYFWQEKINFY